jgi:hypothetical protein
MVLKLVLRSNPKWHWGVTGRGAGAGRAPAAAAGTGPHRGDGGGKGAAAGGGEGRKREALHRQENEEHEETLGTTMVEAHRRRRLSLEPSTKSSIRDEPSVGSTNRRQRHEALDETNAAVPSDSTDDARIESNCSPELEPSPNFGERFWEFWIESESGVSNFAKSSTRGF